ncbi:MAG: pyridoxal-dependent decarboxylase [Bryobacteraceae bacterium]
MSADLLLPSREERIALWSELVRQAESYLEGVESLPVAPALMQSELHKLLDGFSFDDPGSRLDVLRRFTEDMKRHQVHTPHPCYFGLFNPAPAFMGILGESIAATLNPQLAAWSHSPLAVETERRMVDAFARKFGFSEESADGCLTSGGAEANLTALLCALNERWPGVLDNGLQGISARPTFYASAESHHSFLKAARTAGLGRGALRTVPVTDALQMDCDALQRMIAEDRGHGYEPFLVVGTAGTTGAGIVDPLGAMHNVARANGLWFHVDAAWGGAAVLVPELRPVLSGIETADSITFDPHKYLSMPMGAGMSLQWSRRFIGLKLFLTLATTGWNGYIQVLRHQSEMGDFLRERLMASGWRIVNRTKLPVICFTPANEEWDMATHQCAADAVVQSGIAWISTILLGGKTPALRACITNYRTGPEHIETLLAVLSKVHYDLSARNNQARGAPLTLG